MTQEEELQEHMAAAEDQFVEEQKLLASAEAVDVEALEWQEIVKSSTSEDGSSSRVCCIDLQKLDPVHLDKLDNFEVAYRGIEAAVGSEDADIRFINAPSMSIKDISQRDVGRLRMISGVIITFDENRTVKILRDAATCENHHVVRTVGPITRDTCPYLTNNMSIRGKRMPCGAKLINPVFSEQRRVDTFSIRIEETKEEDDLEPSNIEVFFEGAGLVNDVLEIIRSNDRHVKITGQVRLEWEGGGVQGKDKVMKMVMQGLSVEQIAFKRTHKYDYLVRREIPRSQMRAHIMKLTRSYAPQLSSRLDLDTALMALAVGGVPWVDEGSGRMIRGELNIYLLGSPATGKTARLKYMAKLRPNSAYTSGRQATSVGLTAGVIGKQVWMGPYCLAHGGVVLLDEIHKSDKNQIQHLASVMDEEQEIVLAKRGLFTKLSVNAATLAAGNPRTDGGVYDPKASLATQSGNEHWFLSRFDLCFSLTQEDQHGKGAAIWHNVAETFRKSRLILPRHIRDEENAGQLSILQEESPTEGEIEEEQQLTEDEEREALESEFYPLAYMQAEVAYLRETYFPRLVVGSRAWEMMREFWEKFKTMKFPDSGIDIFDNRKINSIVRVARAIARLWRSNVIEVDHMQSAIELFRSSVHSMMGMHNPDLGFVRFAKWLVEQNFSPCLECDGKGCFECDSTGGRFMPVTFSDCADYPYQSEVGNAWNYLIGRGALVRTYSNDPRRAQEYQITRLVQEIAEGGFRANEEQDIAKEALELVR